MRVFNLCALLATAALVSACGGGGQGDAAVAAVDPIPASASATTLGFTSFVAGLVSSETAEPLELGSLVPPTSEVDEPVAVI